MISPLLTANLASVPQILATYKGHFLTNIKKTPENFKIVPSNESEILERTFIYKDFKEAFCHFTLISKTCHSYNYYPELFNVYNRIVVRLSTDANGKKGISCKDIYMALMLN